ncbi:MAG: N-acetyl sugar amidotransferase [Candidatus Nitrosopumilus sp. bin_68KS]
MKICKKCIQPNTRPSVLFNDESICGACLWEEERKLIDWDKRRDELRKIAQNAKNKSKGPYDCVIGVSGGKDSTKQAITARDELELRCLLVNYEPENITELGRQNIENLKSQGFDVITIRPNPNVMKKLIKYDFLKHLNPVKASEFPLYSSTYVIAEKFEIPLIIQGENPGLTVGASLTGVGTDSDALKAYQLQTLSSGWKEYLNVDGITEDELYLFHYDVNKLKQLDIQGIWIQYFLKEWSYRGNAEFSKKYGFKEREKIQPYEIGTYVGFAQIDSDLVHVNQMLKYIKFGFGQCMDHACYDIRDELMDRKTAIDLVLKYDGKCADSYVNDFCKYIEISQSEFWDTAEKFRGEIWYDDGKLHNKLHDLLQNELDT